MTVKPGIIDGKYHDHVDKDILADWTPLTTRQKQLLYECEEERIVTKACLRGLVKLKRNNNMTSWDTAEASNMSLSS